MPTSITTITSPSILLRIALLPSLLPVESKGVSPPCLASNSDTLASSQGAMYMPGGHFCTRTSQNSVTAKFDTALVLVLTTSVRS
jgi:hypothetical protein